MKSFTEAIPDMSRLREHLPSFSEARESLPEISDAQLARGLGWASIAIGVAELAAPRQVEAMLGLDDTPDRRGALRILGIRELCHGVSLLADEEPSDSMRAAAWSRVAGDALDTALLGLAGAQTKKPGSFALVTAAVMGIGLLDVIAAKRLSERPRGFLQRWLH